MGCLRNATLHHMVVTEVTFVADSPKWFVGATIDGASLSPAQQKALDYLASKPGRWVTGEELRLAVYGQYSAHTSIRVLFHRLRARLPDVVIHSSTHLGYMLPRSSLGAVSPRCGRCGCAVVFEDGGDWSCLDCGATGTLPRIETVGPGVQRASPVEGTMQGKAWTEKDNAFIRANAHRMNDAGMAEHLNRTAAAVRAQRKKLMPSKKRYVLSKPRGRGGRR